MLVSGDARSCIRCDGFDRMSPEGMWCEPSPDQNICTTSTRDPAPGCFFQRGAELQWCTRCADNARRCTNSTTILCEDGSILRNGTCVDVKHTARFIHNNHVLKCGDGSYLADGTCLKCGEHCVVCKPQTCDVCEGMVNDGGECFEHHGASVMSNTGVVACADGFVWENGTCRTTASLFESCSFAEDGQCLACERGIVGRDESCLQCTPLTAGGCECNRDAFFDGLRCVACGDHCTACDGGVCLACDNGDTVIDGKCVSFAHPVVKATADGSVTRCAAGFYLENGACHKCVGCATCFNATTCLSCGEEDILSGLACENGAEVNATCKTLVPGKGGCAICRDGFYRKDTACVECSDNCVTCSNLGCRQCAADHWLDTTSLACESYETLTNCATKTAFGCGSCEIGYFIAGQVCTACGTAMDGCGSCKSSSVCVSCELNRVLLNGGCVPIAAVEDCIEVWNSRCVKCTFWHVATSDGTGCASHVVWWVILIAVIAGISLIVVALVIIIIVINVTSNPPECWCASDGLRLPDEQEQRPVCWSWRRRLCQHEERRL